MYDILEDKRVHCTSIMTVVTVGEYLELVDHVYAKKGGIEGQRAPLKTKTALTIRKRMVSDLQIGAVIPPIVVGVLVTAEERKQLSDIADEAALIGFVGTLDPDKISIIDGMQRTTALKEAEAANNDVRTRRVRVEFWITEFLNSLIYRMLVLNTGQVPWELARQLETVYGQFLRKITEELGASTVSIFSKDDQRRRVDAGQYHGSRIVELLLVFSSRKTEVEVRDRVAEDFARLDAIETSAHAQFIEYFIEMLRNLVLLDKAFSKIETDQTEPPSRFASGKEIFGSFPAMVGFAAAVAVFLFDEPGFEINWVTAADNIKKVQESTRIVTEKLHSLDVDQGREFMQLGLLQEQMAGRRGAVGRYERDFFKRAFTAMFKHAERLESLEPCWRAA